MFGAAVFIAVCVQHYRDCADGFTTLPKSPSVQVSPRSASPSSAVGKNINRYRFHTLFSFPRFVGGTFDGGSRSR